VDTSKAGLFTAVTIENLKNGAEMTYFLVSESEANLKEKKISASSPIGKGILGRAIGDIAEVETPAGKVSFKIKNIQASM
jgi:transcription elongation factor GreA